MCEAITATPGVPASLCFIGCLAHLLCCKEDVLDVPKQGLSVSLFSYLMGSDPGGINFHELNLRKCGRRPEVGESKSGRHVGRRYARAALLPGPGEEAVAVWAERLEDHAQVVRAVSRERAASRCRGHGVALGRRSLRRRLCASVRGSLGACGGLESASWAGNWGSEEAFGRQ